MGRRLPALELVPRFQAELDRLFNEVLQLAGTEPSFGEWTPEVDIVETPTAVLILAEVPGIAAADVKVEVRGPLVVLSGTKATPLPTEAKIRFHLIERSHGRFRREIPLFWPVNSHLGRARLEAGVLEIEFPKVQEKRQTSLALPIASAPNSTEPASGGAPRGGLE